MALLHYHIVIKGEHRRVGALTITRAAAEQERGFEEQGGHKAEIKACTDPCFNHRVPA